MKKIIALATLVVIIIFIISSVGSCSDVCTNPTHQNRFDTNGNPVANTTSKASDSFKITNPSTVHFYLESSGSMNGLLRGGVPTNFKHDVWEVISYYSNVTSAISILSTDGGSTKSQDMKIQDFQDPFNGGGFVSGQSTNLYEMISSIMQNTHPESNEVAVFISDMEYDPVGSVAPSVLVSMFGTDMARLLSQFGYSASLVAATSNSVDKTGVVVTEARPYYFLILGKDECVASVRNCISAMLSDYNHFIDNIETGFSYKTVPAVISDYSGCIKINDTSIHSVTDTGCSIELSVSLEKYRWLLSTDKKVLLNSFKIKSENGTQIKVDKITYEINNIVGKELKREATAKIHINITNMPYDCDVLTWNLDIPSTNTSKLAPLFTDVPNSMNQTFSIREFITGMFRGSLINEGGKDNYIHISKK
jgi:hypothetical protein